MEQVNEHEECRKKGFVGYAEMYLHQCSKELKSDDEIDIKIYTQLVELDSKLGTSAPEQLLQILFHTTRFDIIKVCTIVCVAGF